ncbi:MAG: thermonuclease family protein [Methylovulum sp.]|uniref:thermonuclease family protein n=1 Tax=Methylovulum sp. TaxID=1916980 RepID=UPI00261B373F|nr:thermonuclease family protein [Methylovulum sp.]MDD2723334.1 thermonuclease family protein [Methylovulum sp.]MDD5124683.1 thermonuclease family protein [Methylovulum sp.]
MKILLMLWLAVWLNAHADVYQWQDVEGRKHFADKPIDPVAQKLDIKPGYDFFHVKTVYDGDTVLLQDGRRIRFLGVNTPEVAHRGNKADAGGDAAKQWLQEKLRNTRVRLEMGVEKTDKYGRTLAHLITENKEHINVQLVALGLGTMNIFPPNLGYVRELLAAEQHAEQAKLGIWGNPEYAPIAASQVDEGVYDKHHWQRVSGKVQDVYTTGKSVYLKFSDAFAARIEKDNLPLFPDVQAYRGKNLEVRGWLSKNKDRLVMLIRHPSAMLILR